MQFNLLDPNRSSSCSLVSDSSAGDSTRFCCIKLKTWPSTSTFAPDPSRFSTAVAKPGCLRLDRRTPLKRRGKRISPPAERQITKNVQPTWQYQLRVFSIFFHVFPVADLPLPQLRPHFIDVSVPTQLPRHQDLISSSKASATSAAPEPLCSRCAACAAMKPSWRVEAQVSTGTVRRPPCR